MSKSPYLQNSPDSSKSPLCRYHYLLLNHSLAKFVKIAILAEFAGFVKITALSVPLSLAQSLFDEIRQNRHSRRIHQNCRFVGTHISSSITLWRNFVKIAILDKFARFIKIAASSVPLSQAQSLFGEISSKSPFSPNSPDLSKLPLRRFPHLELNRSLAKFRQNCHSRQICRIRQNRHFVCTPISCSIALWRNSSKSPYLPNSPDSSKSLLCQYPYLLLNHSLAKFCQNRHSRQICWIRQNCRFVGIPISSSIALWRNSSKSPFSPNLPDSSKSPLCRYPSLFLNRSLAKFVKIAIRAKFAALSVSISRVQSLFGEILSKSAFSPNLLHSSKSPLRRYPYLELNRSSAKFRQNRHSCQIRRIRQNLRFSGTPISNSIALWRNFVKIATLAKFAGFVKIATSSVPLSLAQLLFGEIHPNRHTCQIRWIHQNCRFVSTPISCSITLWRNFVKIAIFAKFAGFVKIAASSVSLSRAQSLFGEISPKSPYLPNSPDSSKSSLHGYPYLLLNRSLAKFVKTAILAEFVKIAALSVPLSLAQSLFGEIRQNRHSRRIRQNLRFVGTPISSSIALLRNFVKIAILAKFGGFGKIAASSVPLSRAQSLFAEIRQNRHTFRICRICQNCHFVCTPILSSIALWQNFVKIAVFPLILIFGEISSKLPNSPLRALLETCQLLSEHEQ